MIRLYTTAPEAYDYGYAKWVAELTLTSPMGNSETLRVVDVRGADMGEAQFNAKHQADRYRSGVYVTCCSADDAMYYLAHKVL
jgi:hypothetical protein